MSRETLGAGTVPNTAEKLRAWVRDPQTIKEGCNMPNMQLTDNELNQIVAYLLSPEVDREGESMATQDIALSPAAETSLPFTARLHELVVTVDHKKLGLMYIGSALFFFAVAGSLASVIRMQLAFAE